MANRSPRSCSVLRRGGFTASSSRPTSRGSSDLLSELRPHDEKRPRRDEDRQRREVDERYGAKQACGCTEAKRQAGVRARPGELRAEAERSPIERVARVLERQEEDRHDDERRRRDDLRAGQEADQKNRRLKN